MDRLQQNYQYFEEINPGIINKIGRGLKILDIGCGYGHLGEVIKKKDNEVYGIDTSPIAIETAKKRLDFAFIADIAKPETLPIEIKRERFDVILMNIYMIRRFYWLIQKHF
jgi:2-polyprenyl-3-methyl-5-hydroxy-6-metoxy-1,4-benzoquinol methylase